jgi:hypothetical protein
MVCAWKRRFARVLVLAAAASAHGEAAHGRGRAVEGRVERDGQARPHAAQEMKGGGGGASRDRRARPGRRRTRARRERARARAPRSTTAPRARSRSGCCPWRAAGSRPHRCRRWRAARRRLGAQRRVEAFERAQIAFHLDEHAVGGVAHEAVEPEAHGETLHERAKAHTLHDPAHHEAPACRPRRRHGPHPRATLRSGAHPVDAHAHGPGALDPSAV